MREVVGTAKVHAGAHRVHSPLIATIRMWEHPPSIGGPGVEFLIGTTFNSR